MDRYTAFSDPNDPENTSEQLIAMGFEPMISLVVQDDQKIAVTLQWANAPAGLLVISTVFVCDDWPDFIDWAEHFDQQIDQVKQITIKTAGDARLQETAATLPALLSLHYSGRQTPQRMH